MRSERNELQRPVDRVEARATVAMLAVIMIAGPIIGCLAAWHVYSDGLALERLQQSQRFRTQAILVHDAATTSSTYSPGGVAKVSAHARWSAPDGTTHNGQIAVAAGTPAGASVILWTDTKGRPVDTPRDRVQTTSQAILTGVVVIIGAILLLATFRRGLRHILDHHRIAAWEAEWSAIEPVWTGRR